ncbi:MAG: amidohydrolase family protein, partial [Actinobacteria bacterium]|nr:amidohydrolase family protein [Actinomycetota bacterium]NIS37152.1 amidohydrolase family protein [Actinomycetota bacterium]NIT99110.1 amidohydrolase family protein [Actinomycetota bacterium]NIU22719.1 amidohydrolase family protein [Actinomycetota bacterium]NIU71596.1 amidohydrolase family protein [Actinomycetota bacterium]
AWGPAPVAEMLEAGVNVSVGCDGAPSNANMDVLRDLRIACHSARLRAGTRLALGPEAVLEMATINGARALGIDHETGSLEAGKKADFISIDTDAPHLQPVWNPVATAVFAAQGGDVRNVVIDGRVVMRDRVV